MTLGLLLDIDGVMVTSWHALPGAVEAIEELSERGYPRMFLTNTTSRSRSQIAEALGNCGFEVEPDEILTAAKLTAEFLARNYPGKLAWVLNEGPIAEDMTGVPLTDDPNEAQVIVLGGAGPVFTHTALSTVLEKMLAGTPVVAMHRSMIWSTARGLSIDTGVYLEGSGSGDSGMPARRTGSCAASTRAGPSAAAQGRRRTCAPASGVVSSQRVVGSRGSSSPTRPRSS